MGRKVELSLSFLTMDITDAIASLQKHRADGLTHVRYTVIAYHTPKPRAKPDPTRTWVKGAASPGKVRPNGQEGTVRTFVDATGSDHA